MGFTIDVFGVSVLTCPSQQFRTLLILVHRPFAQYNLSGPDTHGEDVREASSIDSGASNYFAQLSRTICFDNAIQVARIFQCHRQRFNTRQIFVTGMQHAGTAATALIAEIALIKDQAERVYPLQCLRILAEALSAMADTYRPAERMLNVLEHVIHDFGWEIDNLIDPAPTTRTQRNLLSRETSSVDVPPMLRKSPTSPVDTRMGNSNPYALTPSLVNDSRQSESFVTTDQDKDFDYANVPFPAMTGANPMSWMKFMSTDNSMMYPGRNDGVDFVSPNDTMMLSSINNPTHYLDMASMPKHNSATREQGALPIDTLSAYNMPKKSQRANYMEGGSMPPSTMHRGSLSLGSPTGPHASWGDVLRQMGDSIE
jgi:hypothetical protein